MEQKVSLRPATKKDREFMEKVYVETRREEFAACGFDDLQINSILEMQFRMQTESYKMQFPDAENSVIQIDETRVGRLIVYRTAEEIRLVDIAVLPEFRRSGIGSFLIGNLQNEAKNEKKSMTLQVLQANEKAFKLYERFGFKVTGNDEIYTAMSWKSEN